MSELIINLENHRSRQRIRNMGEVFTPEQYVNQMLNIISAKTWADEEAIFFEPSAGHGNIVIPIIQKRLFSLERKFKKTRKRDAALYAIANTLNTLWAIDICPLNVELTRKRVLTEIVNYYNQSSAKLPLAKARDFWSHIICTIKWHIEENETLSALSRSEATAVNSGSKTKLGKSWLKQNNYKLINFENTWVDQFQGLLESSAIPKEFLRALRFFDSSIETENPRGFDEFSFAKGILHYAIESNSAKTGKAV